MKKSACLILIACLFLFAGCSPQPLPMEGYANYTHKFRIDKPIGWYVMDINNNRGTFESISIELNQGNLSQFICVFAPEVYEHSLPQVIVSKVKYDFYGQVDMMMELEKVGLAGTLVSLGDLTVIKPVTNREDIVSYMTLVGNDSEYLISINLPKAQEEKFQPTVIAIIKSFMVF